jgi:hypothetical protein
LLALLSLSLLLPSRVAYCCRCCALLLLLLSLPLLC